MEYILYIVGAIIFFRVIGAIANNIKEKEREKKRQEEEQKRKKEEERKREQERLERLEKERLLKEQRKKEQNQVFQEKITKEEVNRSKGVQYEICIVVYKISDFNALIRREDNTFADVVRKSENATPYELYEVIRLETEKIKGWNWFSEEKYQHRKEICEREKRILEEKKEILWNYGINYLYHMTYKDNLEGILKNGLKSHNQVRRENINNVDISDNQVNDRRSRKEPIYQKSIQDYVPLYFNPKNPMLFVRKEMQDDIVILGIDPMVLYQKNSIFTDGNAASNPTKFYKETDKLENLNWQCIRAGYWSSFDDGKRQRCSEVLIYPIIESNQIMKIFCNNPITKEFVKQKIDNFANGKIEVEIKSNLYF